MGTAFIALMLLSLTFVFLLLGLEVKGREARGSTNSRGWIRAVRLACYAVSAVLGAMTLFVVLFFSV